MFHCAFIQIFSIVMSGRANTNSNLYHQSKRTTLSINMTAKTEAVYFGESRLTLAERTKEHTRAVRAADTKRYENADHCWKYNSTGRTRKYWIMMPIQQQGRLKKPSIRSVITSTSLEYHTDFYTSGFLY